MAVALADKLETLGGLFSIGQMPTSETDPYALRRHGLGVIRIGIEDEGYFDSSSPTLDQWCHEACRPFVDQRAPEKQGVSVISSLFGFMLDRLHGYLGTYGYSRQEVDSVLALRPVELRRLLPRLAAVRAFASLPEAAALAAANKRIGNILKKADGPVDAHVSEVLLQEPAEKALFAAMQATLPQAQSQFDAGDFTASLQTLAALRAPVDAYFDGVMVNAEALDVRLNRLGTLKSLHVAMNRVADLSRLAS